MKDPNQRKLRSEAIKKSYEKGTHTTDHINIRSYGKQGFYNGIYYASNIELKRMKFLDENNIKWKRYTVKDFEFRIKYFYKGSYNLYIPDFIIYENDKIIIEEVKCYISKLTEKEKIKIETAKEFLINLGIEYRVVDVNSIYEV